MAQAHANRRWRIACRRRPWVAGLWRCWPGGVWRGAVALVCGYGALAAVLPAAVLPGMARQAACCWAGHGWVRGLNGKDCDHRHAWLRRPGYPTSRGWPWWWACW